MYGDVKDAEEVVQDNLDDVLLTGERSVPCFGKGIVLGGCLLSMVLLVRGVRGKEREQWEGGVGRVAIFDE